MKWGRLVTATITVLSVACGGGTSDQGTPGAGSSSGGSSSGGAPGTGACDAPALDVAVSNGDLAGYPSYAVAGCSLAYVSSGGALVLRDLATGAEEKLAEAAERPRRPSASPEIIAWETDLGTSSIRLRVRATGETKTIAGAFERAGEPRVSGTSVAFTAWVTSVDADVWLYDAISGATQSVFGGPGEQRFADVSPKFVVASDFSEDPDGRYDGQGDLADIVVFDRTTQATSKRAAEKKQAFPMLVNDSLLGYLEWSLVHPEPKLEGYAIRVGRIAGPAAEDQTVADVVLRASYPVRPSTANGMIEWIANGDGTAALWRAPADRSHAPAKVAGVDGLELAAPASAAAFTVVTASDATGPRLRTVAR